MNRWVGLIKIVVISVVLVGAGSSAHALDGSGTEGDPWRIRSLEDFNDFATDANYWDDYTRLETDVNLAGRVYERAVIAPDEDNLGWQFDGIPFTGVFDGNNQKIMNLTIDDGGVGNDCLGLFGCIAEGSKVWNIGLEGGCASGDWYVGHLVGINYGTLSDCYSTGDASGTNYFVGGLVGANGGVVSNCYSTGNVNDYAHVGGLVGFNGGIVSNCYSTGNVSGDIVGGLVGNNMSGSISDCYSTGLVTGSSMVGGLVGAISDVGNVSHCYSTGDVSGAEYVGGLAGAVNTHSSISNCYSISDVNGVEDVGCLVGRNLGSVSNCYSTGDVNGVENVGGLVGQNGWISSSSILYPGDILNCYSTGSVQGDSNVGGLVGYNELGNIEQSYWDIQTSGEPNMCGNPEDPNCDNSYGKTTSQLQQQSTFTNWDFINVWNIGENQTYPYLRVFLAGDINKDRITNFLDLCIVAEQWMRED